MLRGLLRRWLKGDEEPAADGVEQLIADGHAHHLRGELEQAARYYEIALTRAPDHADAHYLMGGLCGQSNRLNAAVAHLKRATELRPQFAAAHSDLATAYRLRGQLNEAVASYRAAARLAPEDFSAQLGLAMTLGHLGRYAEDRKSVV